MNSVLKGKVILIVDDEPELREVITFFFAMEGCVTLEASGGREAFQILRERQIDGVISDIRMADGDGVELLEKVRALHPAIPIVVLVSGFADITEAEAKKKGALGLFNKPMDTALIIKTLAKAFQQSDSTPAQPKR